MENGKSQGKGLLTVPENHRDGLISGKYEPIRINSGDRFQALIGCQYKANDCDIVFRLQYQIGNGQIRTLGQWREVYEGQFYPVNIDLSSLNGEKVKFILSVLANGSAHEDYALWINPRITTHSSQPPTSTPTTAPATAPQPLLSLGPPHQLPRHTYLYSYLDPTDPLPHRRIKRQPPCLPL
jgi:hypothetical protein